MSNAAITVEHLSKRYTLGEVPTMGAFWEAMGKIARRKKSANEAVDFDLIEEAAEVVATADGSETPEAVPQQAETAQDANNILWALKDISFEVPQGEVLGIIGRNGAGKSTLLKILSRITDPTEGRAIIRGRIGSLLEVGTGFHPELTGRENIFLNGSILGMSKREIDSRFKAIVEFSEIGRFIDTPVKRYSSGMFTRLAFSVAANLEPEILIIDEVLSVGDAAFQKKCLTKIYNLMRSGRTVIFVSHSMSSVSELCQSALLLHKGELLKNGPINDIIGAYTDLLNRDAPPATTEHRKGGPGVTVHKVELESGTGRKTSVFDLADDIVIAVTYEVHERLDALQTCVLISRNMTPIFSTFDTDGLFDRLPTRMPGVYRSVLRLPKHFLKGGSYAVTVDLGTITDHIVNLEGAVSFAVEELSEDVMHRGYRSERAGHVISPGTWTVEQVS